MSLPIPGTRTQRLALPVLALVLCAGFGASVAASSLKWVPADPNAPRPGPSAPVAPPPAATPAPQADDTDIPGDASGVSEPETSGINRTGEYLARMDADGDSRVSLHEYQEWLGYAFERMDADGDGVLTAAEQPGGRGATLTRDAHRARVAETFQRQDINRDGSLDTRELAAPPQPPKR